MAAYTVRAAGVWRGSRFAETFVVRCGRVASAPAASLPIIDLSDGVVFPALVNAHDHLELNHYPRSRPRERYTNAHDWGDDLNALLDVSPFADLRAHSLADRCFIGGLKNLLSGALTVAHHNPPHRLLFARDFPVTVLRRYGWTHSLHFSPPDALQRSLRRTRPASPWFIHLAEGCDSRAAGELAQLAAQGGLRPNTVLIHGVGLSREDITRAAPLVRGLVTCPTTNHYLLGQTAEWDAWLAAGGRLALGSDSRLTAAGDLLDELRAAAEAQPAARTLAWATNEAAALIGLPDAGHLNSGARADWLLLRTSGEPLASLARARRADLALVVRGGVPQIGDPDVMARFPDVPAVAVRLDGRPKRLHIALARRLARCALAEPGLVLD